MGPVTAAEVMARLEAKDLSHQPHYARVMRATVVAMIQTEVMQILESRPPEPPPAPPPTNRERFAKAFKSRQNLFTWKQHAFRAILWCLVVWCMAWLVDLPRSGGILFVCWVSMVFADWIDAIMLAHNDARDRARGS